MYQIKSQKVFKKYLEFCIDKEIRNSEETAREQLLKEELGSKASDPEERSKYLKSKGVPGKLRAQKNLVKRQIRSKYSPLVACENTEILSEYEKIEDMAIEINAAKWWISFENIEEQFEDLNFRSKIWPLIDENQLEIRRNIIRLVNKYFSKKQVVCFESKCCTWDEDDDDDHEYYEFDTEYEENPVTDDNYKSLEAEIFYCDDYEDFGIDFLWYFRSHRDYTGFTKQFIIEQFCFASPDTINTILENGLEQKAVQAIENSKVYNNINKELAEIWTPKHLLETLRKNPYYLGTEKSIDDKNQIEEKTQRNEAKLKNIFSPIQNNTEDFFPVTRKLHRKFVLHVDSANSGKPHEVIEWMKKADSGVYLTAHGQLAYEQYISLNASGYLCELMTSEILLKQDNAKYTASTIEMLSPEKRYDVAVIDEAQMIVDKNRGGAWLYAILGVLADEVHVCMVPEVLNIIVKLIEACGDEYTLYGNI